MLTITEALAEIKTIGKRLEKKEAYVLDHVCRRGNVTDPLISKGGSTKAMAEEQQSVKDLRERIVQIRAAIARANMDTHLSLHGESRTIQEWLTWRREIVAGEQRHVSRLLQQIKMGREQLDTEQRRSKAEDVPPGAFQLVVTIDEAALRERSERLEQILGDLDGKLSLLNATITLDNIA